MWDVANTEKLWIMILPRSPKGSDGWESAVRADSQGVRGRSGQRESAKLSLQLSLIPSKKCGNEFWWAWETNWFKRLNSANVGTSYIKQIKCENTFKHFNVLFNYCAMHFRIKRLILNSSEDQCWLWICWKEGVGSTHTDCWYDTIFSL